MIPVTLRISGFLSYCDPVTLDFSAINLACISGANGAGKSSLLDAITWVLFGQARRKDDAIINSHSKSAEVTLDFQYENNLYRVRRIKPRDKTSLLEFYIHLEPDKWKPLTEHSVKETENRIQTTLRMDYETFINASFFLQGKADQFAQQKPGDRKRILGSILGLEVWEEYKTLTANRRRTAENEIEITKNILEEITRELGEESTRRQRLQELEKDLKLAEKDRRDQETIVENIRRLTAAVAEQQRLMDLLARQAALNLNKVDQSRSQLSQRQDERASFLEDIQSAVEIEAAYKQYQETRRQLEQLDQLSTRFYQQENQRTPFLMAVENERTRLVTELNNLQIQADQVEQIEAQFPTLKEQHEAMQSIVSGLAESVSQRPVMEEQIRNLTASRASLNAENERLKKDMNDLVERIKSLKTASGAICPLCGQPLSPDERLKLVGTLEVDGVTMGDRHRANQLILKTAAADIQELEYKLRDFDALQNTLTTRQREADRAGERLNQSQQVLDDWQQNGVPRLQKYQRILDAEDFALAERSRLAEIDASLKLLGYDAASHDALRLQEQSQRPAEEHFHHLEKARAALQPLEREIESMEEKLIQEQKQYDELESQRLQAEQQYLQQAENLPDINREENKLFELQEKENSLRGLLGGARQSVEVLKVLRQRQQTKNNLLEELNINVSRLKILERAFGKDGIPALLIEQALPEIEEDSNNILDRLTTGGMSVRFETQREFKDKNREDKKETLDILISDSAGTREYELFSGGEAFRINFAIRLALSRLLAKRAGARLQTLVIDEGFGSQDNDGRQRLIEAINQVRGDFARILVITHLEELKDAFPARIEVEKTPTGSRVQVIV